MDVKKEYPTFIQKERDFIVDQYEVHELTIDDIAKHIKRSKGYIFKVLKDEGIIRESRGPRK